MTVYKAIVILLTLALAATAYHFVTSKPPVEPSNDAVHENTFDRLRSGMTEAAVEAILGEPHQTTRGEVVRVERPDSPTMSFAIEEELDDARSNALKVYRGRNDESIAVLFAANTKTVTAAEYRVGDCPVIYVGPTTSAKSRSFAAFSTPRIVPSEEAQQQEQKLARFQRRKALGESLAGSFFGSSGAAATVSAPPAAASAALSSSSSQSSQEARDQRSAPQDRSAASAAASSPPQSLKSAEPPPMPIGQRAPSSAGPTLNGPLRIELPTGKVLTESVPAFEPPPPWPDRVFPKDSAPFVARQSNGAVKSVSAVSRAKLTGPSATLYESGRLEALAFYADGKLQGPLRAWTDSKDRRLYAEYKSGGKHGLVCLYQGRLPWLIQEWDKAALEHEYLVKYGGPSPKVLSSTDLADADAKEFARAKVELGALEEELRRDESEVKRSLAEQTRKEEKANKQPKAAAKSPSRSKVTASKADADTARKTAGFEMPWHDALRRSRE